MHVYGQEATTYSLASNLHTVTEWLYMDLQWESPIHSISGHDRTKANARHPRPYSTHPSATFGHSSICANELHFNAFSFSCPNLRLGRAPLTYPIDTHIPVPILLPSSGGIIIIIWLSPPKRARHAFIPPSRMKTVHFEPCGRASPNHPAQRVARPSDEEQWKTTIGIFVRRGINVGSNG